MLGRRERDQLEFFITGSVFLAGSLRCPGRGFANRCDGRQFDNQFLPQEGGCIGTKRHLRGAQMTLPTAPAIRAIPSDIVRRRRLAVGLNQTARFRFCTKIGCIEIVLSSNSDQRECPIGDTASPRRTEHIVRRYAGVLPTPSVFPAASIPAGSVLWLGRSELSFSREFFHSFRAILIGSMPASFHHVRSSLTR